MVPDKLLVEAFKIRCNCQTGGGNCQEKGETKNAVTTLRVTISRRGWGGLILTISLIQQLPKLESKTFLIVEIQEYPCKTRERFLGIS